MVAQIETRSALEDVEAIAAVPDLDVLFVGPADLSAALGHMGNPGHPEVQAAMARVRAEPAAHSAVISARVVG